MSVYLEILDRDGRGYFQGRARGEVLEGEMITPTLLTCES